jgi:hypothetical protein
MHTDIVFASNTSIPPSINIDKDYELVEALPNTQFKSVFICVHLW